MIASLLLEEADYGASVMELYEEVIELLPEDPDLQEKVHVAVIAGVGRRLAAAEDCRYDVPAALRNAAFFVAHDVPQLAPPFPLGVSDVRFVADLAEAGHLRPVRDRTYDLADVAEAHAFVDTGRKRGSVVLRIAGAPTPSSDDRSSRAGRATSRRASS